MNTQELIDRFLDGETTVQEEQYLCRLFQSGLVPPELAPYAEFFRDMATVPVSDKPRSALRLVVRRWVAAAAVVAAFVVGGIWLQVRHTDQLLAQTYGGSYMIVDGQRTDNLRHIRREVNSLLAEADRIETCAQSQQVISDAEQEVLQSVSPDEREELERLLNE